MGRAVVLVELVMVVVVVLSVRSQSRSRCGGDPERRTQGLCGYRDGRSQAVHGTIALRLARVSRHSRACVVWGGQTSDVLL